MKLLLWYSLLFFGCSVTLVAVIYLFAARELKQEANKFLRDEADEFVRQGRARLPDVENLREYLELEIGEKRWFRPFYRVADAQTGRVIMFLPEPTPDLPLTPAALRHARNAETLVETLTSAGTTPTTYRVRTEHMRSGDRPLVLQCGFVFGRLYERLDRLRTYLIFSVLATMIAAVGGGLLLSRRSLQPMTDIIRRLRQIRASDLDSRLPRRPVDDEVGELTDSLNQMLSELETAFNYMQSFTGDVAHELRTPLATIRCELEVTLSRERNAVEYRETLGSLLDRVKGLSTLIEDMLFLARADSSSQPPDLESLDLAPLLEELVQTFEVPAEANEVDLSAQVAPDLTLCANPQWLKIAFANLLDNAIKYTPPGGRVRLCARRSDHSIMASVCDTGPGIPDDQCDRIFDRCYRSPAGDENTNAGTGLGLSITRRIIQLHEGDIDVESEMGRGTTFRIRLPATDANQADK